MRQRDRGEVRRGIECKREKIIWIKKESDTKRIPLEDFIHKAWNRRETTGMSEWEMGCETWGKRETLRHLQI